MKISEFYRISDLEDYIGNSRSWNKGLIATRRKFELLSEMGIYNKGWYIDEVCGFCWVNDNFTHSEGFCRHCAVNALCKDYGHIKSIEVRVHKSLELLKSIKSISRDGKITYK